MKCHFIWHGRNSSLLRRLKDVFRGKTILLPCDGPEWSNFTKFFAENFEGFGLKKLISTSYAFDKKDLKHYNPTPIEIKNPNYDKEKTKKKGKLFLLDRDINNSDRVDIEDLQWVKYLNGDFHSDEVKKLRDEADFIITNPPFSLFREFMFWIMESGKQFLIIGSLNAISYKEIFPLIRDNKIWLGNGFKRGNSYFRIPYDANTEYANGVFDEKTKLVKFRNCCWFTNIEHGRRHQPLPLMTMSENLRYSKHKTIKENGYLKYDNYDAIGVPFTDAITSDYSGTMGVPISFLDKYCPEQFQMSCKIHNRMKGNK